MPTRVLLADDHTLIRESLKVLLERQGFQVVGEASNGQETLHCAEKTKPEVAILDISMPVLNGVDAARELKRSSPSTKIILLTQHDEDQYVTEVLRAGAKGYVLKPGRGRSGPRYTRSLSRICLPEPKHLTHSCRRISFHQVRLDRPPVRTGAPGSPTGWRRKVHQGHCHTTGDQRHDCGIPQSKTYEEARYS